MTQATWTGMFDGSRPRDDGVATGATLTPACRYPVVGRWRFRADRAGYRVFMKDRLLGPLAARWPWFAAVLRVQDRFDEVHGGYLAAAVTMAAFTSIFPLLLVTVGVVGF